jgi:hypothetical protein
MAEIKPWETYEDVAIYILDQIAEQLGLNLEHVEGKQHVYGSKTMTDWEIDGKGVKQGNQGFMIVECRRYPKTRQNQEQVGGLAFRISDTGASGGIYVSPLGFQDGAKKVAAATKIHEMKLRPDSTRTDYVLRFLNQIFVGVSDVAAVTDHISITVIRADGMRETR